MTKKKQVIKFSPRFGKNVRAKFGFPLIPRPVILNESPIYGPPTAHSSSMNKININTTASSSICQEPYDKAGNINAPINIDKKWSPCMDGIIEGNQPGGAKAVDDLIDKVLYETRESPLSVFRKLCRE